MSYSIVSKTAVQKDVVDIVNHYKNISPKLAHQFLFRLREARGYILSSPLAFQVKYKNVRTLMLRQFPYHIHYLIDETKKQIVLIAIIHAYKNPKDYSERI